jgi:hypothetical protein
MNNNKYLIRNGNYFYGLYLGFAFSVFKNLRFTSLILSFFLSPAFTIFFFSSRVSNTLYVFLVSLCSNGVSPCCRFLLFSSPHPFHTQILLVVYLFFFVFVRASESYFVCVFFLFSLLFFFFFFVFYFFRVSLLSYLYVM